MKDAPAPPPQKDTKLTDEEFAALARELFTGPGPDVSKPVVITPQMKHDSDAALNEFDQRNDQVAFTRFHMRQQEEWGAVTAREQAEQLSKLVPLPPQQ